MCIRDRLGCAVQTLTISYFVSLTTSLPNFSYSSQKNNGINVSPLILLQSSKSKEYALSKNGISFWLFGYNVNESHMYKINLAAFWLSLNCLIITGVNTLQFMTNTKS